MEHRNGSRIYIPISVNLFQGGKDLGWYRVKNIGAGGLGMAGTVDGLASNSMVKVCIEQVRDNRLIKHQLDALVVYQKENSMGLMWAGSGTETLDAFSALGAAAA